MPLFSLTGELGRPAVLAAGPTGAVHNPASVLSAAGTNASQPLGSPRDQITVAPPDSNMNAARRWRSHTPLMLKSTPGSYRGLTIMPTERLLMCLEACPIGGNQCAAPQLTEQCNVTHLISHTAFVRVSPTIVQGANPGPCCGCQTLMSTPAPWTLGTPLAYAQQPL